MQNMELEGGERRSSSGKDDGFRAKYVEEAKRQAGPLNSS